MTKRLDAGAIYNQWTVIDGPYDGGNYLCRCSCGIEVVVYGRDVRKGRSKRCKLCGHKQPRSDVGRRLVHLTKDVLERLRQVVGDAIRRCDDKGHRNYGERGIEVKFVSADEFIEYLATLPGHDNLSLVIDRIDNDGHYEAGNLRFATRLISTHNRRISLNKPPTQSEYKGR